jgi:hypothetical protein
MTIAYCRKWWFERKKALNLLSTDAARRRHQRRQPYVALLGGSERPHCVLELTDSSVSAGFLDERLRQYLRYDFRQVAPGKLFLKAAYHWEYPDEGESSSSKKIFNFEENGSVFMVEYNPLNGESTERETWSNIEPNWESYPEFGKYESICRLERGVR